MLSTVQGECACDSDVDMGVLDDVFLFLFFWIVAFFIFLMNVFYAMKKPY